MSICLSISLSNSLVFTQATAQEAADAAAARAARLGKEGKDGKDGEPLESGEANNECDGSNTMPLQATSLDAGAATSETPEPIFMGFGVSHFRKQYDQT